MNTRRIFGNFWIWLGFSLLLVVTVLAIQNVTRPAQAATNAGSPSPAQSVPDASVQGVANYINAHSDSSAQAVPEAAVQGVTDYLQAHNTGPTITDPAAESVMDYLRAHGVEVP